MIQKPEPLHILVIEDHQGDFEIIKRLLNAEIKTVYITRTSLKEAKNTLLASSFNTVLLDLSIPVSSYCENMVKEVVLLAKKAPVIVFTNNSDEELGIKSLSLGIVDYLNKDELNALQLSKSIYYSIERKKIENKLSESEKKYRSLFDLSPLPMWVLDRQNLNFLSVNDAAIQLYGFSREEFLNMHVRDLWDSQDKPEIERIVDTGKDDYFNITITHLKKNGEKMILEVQSNPIVFDGIPARVSLLNNITAQVKAEQALQRSEQRFKALVQEGSDLVMILDYSGKITYVSPSANSVTGISSEDLLKNNFFFIIHPSEVDMVVDHINKLKDQKRVQIPSYRIQSSDNSWRWIETIVTNLTEDPAVKGIVANSRDITQFVLQEKQLRESLNRYDIVAKATSDTIFDYDMVNDIMEYNEGIQNMFGYSASEVQLDGKWWMEKLHPEDYERVRKTTDQVYKNGENQLQIKYRFRCSDGNYKSILVRSYLLKDEAGKPIRMIGSMEDITEINNYIKTIEDHNARLKEIAWTQSHVVRAPLARIMGLIDLLENHEEVEDRQLLLKHIMSSARELDKIIRKINSKTEEKAERQY